MPTGCCGGGTCSCRITTPEDSRFIIAGSGQPSDPFVLDIELVVEGGDNTTFDTSITGSGSTADPFVISTAYAASARLDDLPDVNVPSPSNGQVLAWNTASGRWVASAPTTAPTGAVQHGTSLSGDGSAGSPLNVATDSAHLMASWPAGVGLSDAGMTSVTRHFIDAAARTAGLPTPTLNALSMLDTAPGVVDFWNGIAWQMLPNQTRWNNIGQFMQLSGPWTAGLAPTVLVRQVSTTTDGAGLFDVLSTTDLSGFSGVLTVAFQETGSVAWKCMVNPGTGKVVGTAYRMTDGSVFAGQPITGTVQAILY